MERSQDYIRDLSEYDNHHLVTFLHDDRVGMKAFVAIHRKNNTTPSFGATRLWKYETDEDALRDALRLSRLMSYKAALAGLPCGGAKGVIMCPDSITEGNRQKLIKAYASKISTLKDSFITGTDVGIRQSDLTVMKKLTSNIIGFNDNTAEFTALGVYYAIQCCLKHVFGNDRIKGRSFAIQGVGKVGGELLRLLLKDAKTLYVSDIDARKLATIRKKYPRVKVVQPDEIHRQAVDVFSPCALNSAINTGNVAELHCKIICGAANNQLEKEEVGDILHKMNMLYAPDYVVNAGGLIAVYDEHEHSTYDQRQVQEKVVMIRKRLHNLISESRKRNRPTNRIANEKAEKIFNGYGK